MIQTLDLNNSTLKEKDIVSNWDELIYENEGQFSCKNQYMVFDCNGIEVLVDFELNVSGTIYEDCGDYWTSPSGYVETNDIKVDVESLYVEETQVMLTKNMENILKKLVLEHI